MNRSAQFVLVMVWCSWLQMAAAADPSGSDIREPAEVQQLLDQGAVFERLGDKASALKAYDEAVQLAPTSASALALRGKMRRVTGHANEAIGDYDKAISFDPKLSSAHVGRALALDALGRYEEALQSANRGIQLTPERAVVWSTRALIHLHQRHNDSARVDAEKAVSLDQDNADAWGYLGILDFNDKRYDSALRNLDHALQLDTQSAHVWHWRGLTQHALGAYSDAISSFSGNLSLKPGNPAALTARGDAWVALGQSDKAEADYRAALASKPGYGPAAAGLSRLTSGAVASGPAVAPSSVTTTAQAVPGKGWQGPFTYVQQSHGTCWAATALMLIRAYGGEANLFDLMGAMGTFVDAREGVGGAYGLGNTTANYRKLVEVMNGVTPGQPFALAATPYGRYLEWIASGWVDGTEMSAVLGQWQVGGQAGLPFIHASAKHAWLMLRRDATASAPTWIVHDPKGGASAGAKEPGLGDLASEGGPYWVVGQDWLQKAMREKNDGYSYIAQIIYPTKPAPVDGLPMQSLAIPFVDKNGNRSQGKLCLVGNSVQQRCMAWRPLGGAAATPYAWQSCTAQRCQGDLSMVAELPLERVQIDLDVWNVDVREAQVEVRAGLNYGGGAPGPDGKLRSVSTISLAPGKSSRWSAELAGVCSLRQPERAVDAVLDIELWNGQRRLDHLPLQVSLAPRARIDRVNPASPKSGERITIEGAGFGSYDPANAVDLDGSVVSVERWSDRAITITLPATAVGSGTLRVKPAGSEDCAVTAAISVAASQATLKVPADSAGCWFPVGAPKSSVVPPDRGNTGSETVTPTLIEVATWPSNPNWSHLTYKGELRVNLNVPLTTTLCHRQVIGGSVSFSNLGVQFFPGAYTPSGSLSARFSGHGNQALFELASRELPPPGQSKSVHVSWQVPEGSPGETMQIVSLVHAGRDATYTWSYRWVSQK